jgi:UDP-N-acetylmuramoyl-L-alanyl-D-glutamate--2,6-diaminopimelate ligase
MKDYREAKGRIFASLNHSLHKTTAKTIIVNADDKSAGYYYHFDAERKITYGLNNGEIWATNMYFDQFTEFELVDGDERYPVKTSLPAKFNIYNLLAAYTVGKALCFKPEKIIKGLEKVKQIEGRMQEVPNTRGVKIYVDYAMTPDAYENLFREARRVTKGKLIAVFGAAGDRDKTKRPLIGEVAAKMADYTIITEDEPYSEKTEKIIQEIEEGYKKIRENDYVIVLDRREALKRSISMAKTGDTIVIPGMGHERFRNIGGNKKIAWNEVQIIQELLEEINSTKK